MNSQVLPVIVSCKKNEKYWPAILENNKSAILFYGDPQLDDDYKYDEATRILTLKCCDFYEGLPEKMISLINSVLKLECFNKIQYIVKIDDHDIIRKNINMKYILDVIHKNPTKNYLGIRVINVSKIKKNTGTWHFGKCSKGSFWEKRKYTGPYTSWADGGRGYILSRNSMENISKIYNFNNLHVIKKHHICEDLMIALILRKFSIYPKQL